MITARWLVFFRSDPLLIPTVPLFLFCQLPGFGETETGKSRSTHFCFLPASLYRRGIRFVGIDAELAYGLCHLFRLKSAFFRQRLKRGYGNVMSVNLKELA